MEEEFEQVFNPWELGVDTELVILLKRENQKRLFFVLDQINLMSRAVAFVRSFIWRRISERLC